MFKDSGPPGNSVNPSRTTDQLANYVVNGGGERSTNGNHSITRGGGERLSFIVHCHLRWDFVWQRPQQIFSRLAADHDILFIEEPQYHDAPPFLQITSPYGGVIRVLPLLTAGAKTHVDEESELILRLLQQALAHDPRLEDRFQAPVQWFYSPMTAPAFAGRFGARSIVYDCMDELANFRFAPPDIGERERFLLSKADVVFTGGFKLFEAKSRHHENVHFFGCGVDTEHYGKARLAGTAVPMEVAHLAKPIFGYFGVIDERIDYDLLSALGNGLPDASIVMVGPLAKVERQMLPDLPNIHWIGQRSYAELPALVKAFDVCLMPFALNESTQFINPTKTLEYMAAGKPIVSTAVPDVVHNFTPIVSIADSHDEFVRAVERAYQTPPIDLIAQGIERANAASWEATVCAMRDHVFKTVRNAVEPVYPVCHSAFP